MEKLEGLNEQKDDIVVNFSKVDYAHPNGVRALRNVNLSIKRGELIGIMGTNGAGKSTLVRHMNALLKPTHGSVEVFGIDTKKTTSAALSKRVGIVFQNANNQLFSTSVRSEIEFGLKNFGFPQETISARTAWALDTFSLREYEFTPPMELSGGEKKRLCNALVLAWDPDILILDEPTVGQDSHQKDKLVNTIEMLLAQKKTVILVTHDVEFVWPLQPRTLLMHDGTLVADGPAQEVFRSNGLTSANVLPPQLVELFQSLFNFDTINRYPGNIIEARNMVLARMPELARISRRVF